MKIAAMQFNPLNEQTDREAFARAKALGFHGVEPVLSAVDLEDPSAKRLASLKEAAAATGLEIPSLCLGPAFQVKQNLLERAAAVQRIQRAVDWAVELKAKIILLAFFNRNEVITSDDFHVAADGFRTLCAYAGGKGVKMTYEGTFRAERLAEFARTVDSPAFGDYFDMANVVWLGQDTADQIRKRGPLIAQVHFKETRFGPGDCRPGQGRVNYTASAQALKEIGYNSWLVFEVPSGTDEELRADIAAARQHFSVEA
jgi:sugar phosphate isomerase/epimerase